MLSVKFVGNTTTWSPKPPATCTRHTPTHTHLVLLSWSKQIIHIHVQLASNCLLCACGGGGVHNQLLKPENQDFFEERIKLVCGTLSPGIGRLKIQCHKNASESGRSNYFPGAKKKQCTGCMAVLKKITLIIDQKISS